MKSFSRCILSVLVGSVGVTGAWGVAVVGCGGDDSSTGPSASLPDGTTEGSAQEDAPQGTDQSTTQPDVLAQPDVSHPATEAGPDVGAPDGDAGSNVRGFEGGAASFPAQLAASVCGFIANCCGTTATAPTFNAAACDSTVLPGGFQGSATGANLFDGGNIAFNAATAQACLDDFARVDCSTNQAPSPIVAQIYKDCFGAYSGLLAVGAPCKATIECAPGGFCLPADGGVGDAGAIGLCQTIAGSGAACGLLGTSSASQNVCSYRGSGNTGLFCKSYTSSDASATTTSLGIASWACEPQEPLGTSCLQNEDCASFGCHSHQCATTILGVGASTCTAFAQAADASTGD
jgi:hypothetical protein